MNKRTRVVLFLTRISLGGIFFYAGITKVFNPEWSSAGYLSSAKTFPGFYNWLALSTNIGWVNFLNEWGLTLIGAALILGIFTRYAAYAGVLIMALYYFPILSFPYVGDHSFIVDDHVVYALTLLLLAFLGAGKYWGLDTFRKKA